MNMKGNFVCHYEECKKWWKYVFFRISSIEILSTSDSYVVIALTYSNNDIHPKWKCYRYLFFIKFDVFNIEEENTSYIFSSPCLSNIGLTTFIFLLNLRRARVTRDVKKKEKVFCPWIFDKNKWTRRGLLIFLTFYCRCIYFFSIILFL